MSLFSWVASGLRHGLCCGVAVLADPSDGHTIFLPRVILSVLSVSSDTQLLAATITWTPQATLLDTSIAWEQRR